MGAVHFLSAVSGRLNETNVLVVTRYTSLCSSILQAYCSWKRAHLLKLSEAAAMFHASTDSSILLLFDRAAQCSTAYFTVYECSYALQTMWSGMTASLLPKASASRSTGLVPGRQVAATPFPSLPSGHSISVFIVMASKSAMDATRARIFKQRKSCSVSFYLS